MKRLLLVFAVLSLALGAGGVWLKTHLDNQNAIRTAQEQKQQQSEQKLSKYEVGPPDPQEILELVNQERARVGVAPLVVDENVQRSAQLKSDDMLAKGYKEHDIPGLNDMYTQEMRNFLYGKAQCSRSGENFYWAEFAATSRHAFNWWMHSKPHREAIQNPDYIKTGFGVSHNIDNHNVYVVQHFCVSK